MNAIVWRVPSVAPPLSGRSKQLNELPVKEASLSGRDLADPETWVAGELDFEWRARLNRTAGEPRAVVGRYSTGVGSAG